MNLVRLFVPTFNAGSALPGVIGDFADLGAALSRTRHQLRVLFIDDGSTDRTAEVLSDLTRTADWAEVVRNDRNRGNAYGIEMGYRWALRCAPGDYVGCCDADGEHNPTAFARHLREYLLGDEYHGVVGSIIYPQHSPNWADLNMMRFAGAVQSLAVGADRPFYIQSPGWQLHRAGNLIRDAVVVLLPEYREFFKRETGGPMPRWGLHGVIDHLLSLNGARLRSAYLECFGDAPNRTPDKLRLQAQACLIHLDMIEAFAKTKGLVPAVRQPA